MKTAILSERLLEVIKTKEDSNDFLTRLDLVIGSLFKSSGVPIDVMTAFMPYGKKEWILSLIHEHDLDLTDINQMVTFLKTLKETISGMPMVELSLAFEPTEKFVEALSNWFLGHCKKPVLLDIYTDQKIIGGAVIGYKGNFKDYSILKALVDKQKAGELQIEINE